MYPLLYLYSEADAPLSGWTDGVVTALGLYRFLCHPKWFPASLRVTAFDASVCSLFLDLSSSPRVDVD